MEIALEKNGHLGALIRDRTMEFDNFRFFGRSSTILAVQALRHFEVTPDETWLSYYSPCCLRVSVGRLGSVGPVRNAFRCCRNVERAWLDLCARQRNTAQVPVVFCQLPLCRHYR